MGVDWVQMRPRPGISAASFDEAIRAQAAQFVASGCWFSDEFGHITRPAPATPGPRITEMVHVNDRPGNTHRVNALVLTPLLPAEWRFAMYRSFLPEDLARHISRWRAHIDEVRAGGHRAYLQAWYAYTISQRLAEEWTTLRQLATNARTRTNAWAVRPALVEVRERITVMAEPTVSPPPRWGRSHDPHPIDATPFVELAREWNRRVPANQKVHVPKPPSYEEFLDDPSPDDTLVWLEASAEEGYGVLLDW
ncbi:hypothetical protein [Actinomadura madurae]|uniref:hypothetical protein n=1 Tax=Actinomadura madurae TaxID=1993 RepID=UPI000D938FCB|nr:hypothetical protein [Actinomadura madurae]SPT63205.1 Uncharacterised protein [Actinomadura madurae]